MNESEEFEFRPGDRVLCPGKPCERGVVVQTHFRLGPDLHDWCTVDVDARGYQVFFKSSLRFDVESMLIKAAEAVSEDNY